jgi:hypothetical protein
MLVIRIDKHPSDGGRPEHIETITVANLRDSDRGGDRYGVWRNSRSIQEAPDAIVQHHPESGAAELVHRAITSTRDPDTHITRRV